MTQADDRVDEVARAKRIVELAYAVEGVVAVRVWSDEGRIAVGIRGNDVVAPTELIARVRSVLGGAAAQGETIDVGLLSDEPDPVAERSAP